MHSFYFGDNKHWLQCLHKDGVSVDLVYIDPPFGLRRKFMIDGDYTSSSIRAGGAVAYDDTMGGEAYLDFMRMRLRLIRDVMSETASIYVHIDTNMEHHLRFAMDDVFGEKCFRTAIARIKCDPQNFPRYSYGRVRDSILFYSKSPIRSEVTWNPQREPLSDEQIRSLYAKIDKYGRRFTTTSLDAPGAVQNGPTGAEWRGVKPPKGRHWRTTPDKMDRMEAEGKIYWSKNGKPRRIRYAAESEGQLPQDVWTYKDPKKVVYPTQKNADMLKRIILTSSNPGDTVLDCFAGSGSTLIAAHYAGRTFIGMDESPEALGVCQRRFREARIPVEWYG